MDKKKILVVDDDADLLDMLKIRIESEGFEFISAKDGEEMLKTVKVNKPDLIILDIMLPKIDGYTALREMRKEEEFKDMPIIILTAKEKRAVGDLFALEKVTNFIEKPFEPSALLNKIRSLL
jgi:DNA-binding response OmpR family regulator